MYSQSFNLLPDELPDLPNTGRQVGDVQILRSEVSVHLPDCKANQVMNGRTVACKCLARLADVVTGRVMA